MLPTPVELLKKSFALYKDNFPLFAKYIALNLIMPIISTVLMVGLMATLPLFLLSGSANIFINIIGLIVMIGLGVIIFYITTWFSFAWLKIINDKYNNYEITTLPKNIKTVRPLVWRGVGSSLLAGLISGLPFFGGLSLYAILSFLLHNNNETGAKFILLFCSLIGIYGIFHLIYFSVKLQFGVYGVLFQNKKVIASLKHSAEIIKNKWWAVFGRILFVGLATWIVIALTMLITDTIAQINFTFYIVLSTFMWLVQIFAVQLVVIAIVILYNSLNQGDTEPIDTPPLTDSPEPPMMQ